MTPVRRNIQSSKVRRFFSGAAPTYDAVCYVKPPFQDRLSIVESMLKDVGVNEAWDIGCGTGAYFGILSKTAKKIIAVDFAPEMLVAAKRKAAIINVPIEFIYADILEMQEGKNTADLLLCLGVIEYVDNPMELLKKLRKISSQNALLILSFPNLLSLIYLKDRLFFQPLEWFFRKLLLPVPEKIRKRRAMTYIESEYIHHHEFSCAAVKRMLAATGFQALEFVDYNVPPDLHFFWKYVFRLFLFRLPGSAVVVKARAFNISLSAYEF